MIHDAVVSREFERGLVHLPAVAPMENDLEFSIPNLARSGKGRALSRFRYHNAESFFSAITEHRFQRDHNVLYRAGIVAQLALSSHLLDVGVDDAWCARNLGLDIRASLACANATGLGHTCSDFARLAATLSPYCQWRNSHFAGERHFAPSSLHEIPSLLRELLNRIREVTGHSRPSGSRARHSL